MTPEELIKTLGLVPHPAEGGFFVETYRAKEGMAADLPSRYGARRDFGTAIYYLLTPETFSALHLLQSDEIFHCPCFGPKPSSLDEKRLQPFFLS